MRSSEVDNNLNISIAILAEYLLSYHNIKVEKKYIFLYALPKIYDEFLLYLRPDRKRFLNPASFEDVQFLNFIEAITIKLVDTFRTRN